MQQKTILIVDDDTTLREAVKGGLEVAGFKVIEAKSGAEGLAQAFRYKPDLILLDIMMANMSGHKTLYELRKDPWGKDVKVIMLTALDDAENISQDVELKSSDYIIKSNASLELIIKKVKQHLAGYT